MATPDTVVYLKAREIRPIYGTETVDVGNISLVGTPTVTVYDNLDLPVEGYSAEVVTGVSDSPASTLTVWWVFDTNALPAARYTVEITGQCKDDGDDPITRTFVIVLRVYVAAVP